MENEIRKRKIRKRKRVRKRQKIKMVKYEKRSERNMRLSMREITKET